MLLLNPFQYIIFQFWPFCIQSSIYTFILPHFSVLLSSPIANDFFCCWRTEMPLRCSVSMFFAITFNLQSASYEYLFFFSITKLATNKNIVLLPITQITFNSSSLLQRHRLQWCIIGSTMFWVCYDWTGGRQCQQACESSQLIFVASVHCCRQLSPMLPDRDRFPATSNTWPFLRLVGILNQTLDIFILISRIRHI